MADTPDSTAPTPPAAPRSEEEILADPQLRELLAGYHPIHHELFLKGYARVLADLHRNGAVYEQNLEYLLHQHDDPAGKYLWIIQHQKLFDLECQWRAGLVEVPGARLTADFEDWHTYIEECPVLSPIGPDEVALLGAFMGELTSSRDLPTGNLSHTFWFQRRHPDLRDYEDEDEDPPLTAFTEFWDLHRGMGYLRQLPDLRGEKEQRYTEVVYAEHRRLNPHTPEPEDPRPYVPTYGEAHDDIVRDWLRRFEPAVRLRQFETKQQLEAYDASEDRLDLPLALERLQNAGPGLIPVEAHADWRQALMAAGHRHYLDQVRAALATVYDDYAQREALGISHTPPDNYRRSYSERGSSFAFASEQIREGRRLLGEPDDLNF